MSGGDGVERTLEDFAVGGVEAGSVLDGETGNDLDVWVMMKVWVSPTFGMYINGTCL